MISITAFTNLNNAVPWGLWVSIYIWLVGISAGVFALVAYGNLRSNPHLKNTTRLGLALALAALLAGLLSIQIDLGHIERFYKLFISPNPASVMDIMVWLYGVYCAILAIAFLKLKKGISKSFYIFSLIFTLGIIVLESLLFAVPPGKHWHSLIFPLHFLTASLASAISALLFISGILWVKTDPEALLRGLSKIALPLVAINLIVEIIDIFSFAGFNHIMSWGLILGSIISILLLRRATSLAITAAGFIQLIVIFFSKYNSLISAQLEEPFKGFAKTYIEPRLVFSYAPNSFEIFIALLLVSLAAGIFYFLYKIMPLTREE